MSRALQLMFAVSLTMGIPTTSLAKNGAQMDLPRASVVALYGRRGLVCSGVVIAPRLILSARHCQGVKSVIYTSSKNIRRETAVIRRRFPRTTRADIAVFEVKDDLLVTPVALRTMPIPTTQTPVVAMGFGRDTRIGSTGGILRELPLTMRGSNCNGLGAIQYGCVTGMEFVLPRNDSGHDTCSGDSGGPVFVRTDLGWEVIGITSRSVARAVLPCGDGGIYSLVAPLQPWFKRLAHQNRDKKNNEKSN